MYRLINIAVAAAVLLVLADALLTRNSNKWDRFSLDIYAQWLAPEVTSDAVCVRIDATSIAEYGGWPWSRGTHAKLVGAVAGAKVLAYDIVFVGRSGDRDGDMALEQAVADAGNVVLPLLAERNHKTGQLTTLFPFGDLATSARLAHIDMPLSQRRRLIDIYLKAGNANAQYPLFAQAVAQKMAAEVMPFRGTRPSFERRERAGLWVRDYANLLVPIVDLRTMECFSAGSVLSGAVAASVFRDKAVFVGLDAEQLTPKLTMAGFSDTRYSDIDIQIQAYEAIQHGHLLQRAPNVWGFLTALVAALLAFALARANINGFAKWATILALLALLFVVPFAVARFGYWILQGHALLIAAAIILCGLSCRLMHLAYFRVDETRAAHTMWSASVATYIQSIRAKSGFAAAALIELDQFDRYQLDNSTCAAARAYTSVSSAIRRSLKGRDFVLEHYTRQRMMLFLQVESEAELRVVLENVINRVEALNIVHSHSTVKPYLTVTMGVAISRTRGGFDEMELLGNVEAALHQAIAKGRNQIALLN